MLNIDIRVCTASLIGLLILTAGVRAHGGQYRGPGDIKPSSSSGSNGSATDSGGSGGSGGSRRSRSGGGGQSLSPGSSPSAGAAAQPRARGAALDIDLTQWEFWWEFGKDPFLRLRDAVHSGRSIPLDEALLNPRLAARAHHVELPTETDLADVADRLVGILGTKCSRDTTSACLVALAKIGRDGIDWRLREVLLPFLQRNDQEIRETAALSLGIAGMVDSQTIAVLGALVRDDALGRKLSGGSPTNERTRAFAAFGLGLLLQRTRDAGMARRIVEVLSEVVESAADNSRDLVVATIEALSLFPAEWEGDVANVLRAEVVERLGAYYKQPLGSGDELVQAHVPPAVARLLRPRDVEAARWRDWFVDDLESQLAKSSARANKVNPHIAQSCALALGSLTPSWEVGAADSERIGRLLLRVHRSHKDHQTRRFALISLGRMGGKIARDQLLRCFDAARVLEQPWAAMALGIMVAQSRSSTKRGAVDVDPDIAKRLRAAFAKARNPSAQAGLAIALGLVGDCEAGDSMRDLLQARSHQDQLAGYLAIGLGLMRDDLAIGDVRELMRASQRRPQVVFHCAQALGLLGDHEVTDELCRELETEQPSLVRLSAAASALGQIGDRRSLKPLRGLLERKDITPLTRAFAVVALGSVCDKDPLPWNVAYATDCNYRASTSTLTDGASGILDIL